MLSDILQIKRVHLYALLGALLVGFLARAPGILWGFNFPTGWYGHHPDEYTHLVNAETLIAPNTPPRWEPHPYPKGMAAHVAVPIIGFRLIQGKLFEALPSPQMIITLGRVINVLYGVVTIFIVFLLARRLFRDPRVALISAWIVALGGLHVSQSHFFVSDVPSLFWFLLGTYFLLLDVDREDRSDLLYLSVAAISFGISFGLKLSIYSLLTLALIAIAYQPRVKRLIQAAAFFFLGFVVVNLISYTPLEIFKTFRGSAGAGYEYTWWSNLLLYMVELPTVVSLPVVLLFLGGSVLLFSELKKTENRRQYLPLMVIVFLPLAINLFLTVFTIDHFPRHLVFFIPWISMLAGWSLVWLIDKLGSNGMKPALVLIPVFLYLTVFVLDGERLFIDEPRNQAAKWILQNIPSGTAISWWGHEWMADYEHIGFPDGGEPPVLVIEMHHANHFLSGMGLKNSYPADYRFIFMAPNQDRVDAFQALFIGELTYQEIARFSEGYFMPEYKVVDDLIGNRSRNYIAEVVIFEKGEEFTQNEQ